MPTFYVDETGFTGEDLMEVHQPIFAQATHDFSAAETDEIIGSIFKDVRANELKYKSLSRRPAHQGRIVELVKLAAKDPKRVATWVAQKEYGMLTFVVEWWIEPLAYKLGINLYKDGGNQALSNMLFICLTGFWDEEVQKEAAALIPKDDAERTKERFDECRELVRKAKANVWGDEKRSDLINYFWPPFDELGFGHLSTLPDHALDLALPGLVSLAQSWRAKNDGPWQVIHDRSSNMGCQAWLWEKFSSPDIDKAQFPAPHGDGIFPLNVTSTTFADSRSEKQIQICDILAGATAAGVRLPESDEYRKNLREAGIMNLVVGAVWPSNEVTPQGLGREGWDGNQMIEWLTEQMEKKDTAKLA